MTSEISQTPLAAARAIHLVSKNAQSETGLGGNVEAWIKSNGFEGQSGRVLILPDTEGGIGGVVLGMGEETGAAVSLSAGKLGRVLPAGEWRIASGGHDPHLTALGFILGGYSFDRYRASTSSEIRQLALPEGADFDRISREADAVYLTRDLINTPTNDMGPQELEDAVRRLATRHGARVDAVTGDALLAQNFPMIHAVGRASAQTPRLIDLVWGDENSPKVTLVGKGVCFDTGGLDIKPASGMLLMKKDMGGAANVIGLASMIMAAKLKVRLRVLIPAVENAISGSAFRPGDVLSSRKGPTVEIGNTDAEGRLVLADALALADEEKPELLIDMATLTGAARVALGPDLSPFFTDDAAFASSLAMAGERVGDPVWHLPLWKPYAAKLSSRIADLNNVTSDGFGGSITAALFLQRFVEHATTWCHLDIYGWNPSEKPHAPVGGEAQAIRALMHVIEERYTR